MNEFEQQTPSLRTAGDVRRAAAALGRRATGQRRGRAAIDLLAATGLVPADRLALVRGRVQQGSSLAQAILDENVATSEGIARALAVRFHLPLVDLALNGVDPEAAKSVPLHVLERIAYAIPYELRDGTLRVAVADPSNLHSIDEPRLATRFPLEIGVASREDIEGEIRRLVRASRGIRRQGAAVDEELVGDSAEEEADDLEVDDGISDAPLVRLVNSVIFQAAGGRSVRHPLRAAGGLRSSCGSGSTACRTRCSGSQSG